MTEYKKLVIKGFIGILLFISLPLVLGSLVGLIPGCLSILLLIIRTHLEDMTLQKELPGYKQYSMKVKYKLLPGVW
jgi:protein-S-isoprenylcysteine O-methyltransferase Ste14